MSEVVQQILGERLLNDYIHKLCFKKPEYLRALLEKTRADDE